MQKSRSQIDIVNEVLEDCIIAYPISPFIISLYKQYQQRGSLSKKQLQGLHSKASAIKDINHARLATLEAIIKKMPTRQKSELPVNTPLIKKDETTGRLIDEVLTRYPSHKAVLFLKAKYDNDEFFSLNEMADLERFFKIASLKSNKN